ncbi:MAG TPA: SemiSWEET family transporter [Kofleriaceae bacterium]|jgi:MtN3 and saliva related transmembrane protein|nr:SemiSWEET family transporter [Kofleriaceae bacterium]
MIATVVGALAALLSVTSFVPQAWHVIRTRKTEQLVTPMWLINVVGFSLWTTYGVLLERWAIVAPNVICWVLSAFILVMKLVSPRTRHAIADVLDPAVDPAAPRATPSMDDRAPDERPDR